ncbi:hypothetical protein RIF29_36442 [Crotalaria pallida]|uniref:Uncharacterized protein n=1 Tax=Crotalaria pallida TaxID=3830 RepID=A0AAN9EBG6_CROPI
MEIMQGAAGSQDNSIMTHVDQRSRSKGRSDIMTRRLKNKERQRRYRARKRQEAEARKASVIEELVPEPPGNGNRGSFVVKRHCIRDWKKDARRAHLLKREEMNESVGSSPSAVPFSAVEKKEEPIIEEEMYSGSVGGNNKSPRTVLSGRKWKAEARRVRN